MKFTNTITALSALGIAAVSATPCTSDQLDGYYSSFSLPGGGGDYYPGTKQVVSWNWATGSDVSDILGVTIMNNTDIVTPTQTRGVPVSISPTDYDQAGAIVVTLPNDLVDGKYVYGVLLKSGSDQCTIYSEPFNIVSESDDGNNGGGGNNGGSGDKCEFGDTRCARQSTGFRSCIQTPHGRRFAAFQQCPGGQTCEQANNNAYCAYGTGNNTTDRCQEGETRCARNGEGYRTCIRTQNGLRFRALRACPSGQTCQQNESGATCSLSSGNNGGSGEDGGNTGNESGSCDTYAQYSCNGDGYRVCVQDVYGNLTWSATTSCGNGKTCQEFATSVVCIPK